MVMAGSIILLLALVVAVIAVMCVAEGFIVRKFGLWGLVIPIVSCVMAFLNIVFLIGAAIQFITFVAIYRKQKKQDEIDKMNIQDL
ncbi:hypothetical protein [Christensenella tenuis]|jgi:predicted membrane-bound dolichyl-phosphate-mannose-protein mannosyltransferase|uniref:Uncharacterized protein n=1 Tax=Christensenella tenuis TaxID=2763033 RepID=A0ABR7EHH3_9FIRM|nr:hypothetical protein [Christensenella tenuis]MBC5648613.1 hypothetical protein [Christensenella tenuis]